MDDVLMVLGMCTSMELEDGAKIVVVELDDGMMACCISLDIG